ncbi:nitrilase-related carbon-nitrogen hydrolase [Candidatus Palauibacter sp.]|uniref:nitrilase-related carbon-nitrogen hydrolase n=1 Tax=Candidatus Palauibacter sp. TaxID=3101350 RepID=UPI003B5B9548
MSGPKPRRPDIPAVADFGGETVHFALFPEGYISSDDSQRIGQLSELATGLNAPLLVGAVDMAADSSGRPVEWQILLRFDPDGTRHCAYTKHSLAQGIAFDKADWAPDAMLPTFDLAGVTAGATICNDHYLGLLPRFLRKRGAHVWVNPSYENVRDIKWSSVLRLRAVENRFFALCTLHDNVKKLNSTHPFAFSPDGRELSARKAGAAEERVLSKCREPGIYMVELDMSLTGAPLDRSQLPCRRDRQERQPPMPVRMGLVGERPAVYGKSGWQVVEDSGGEYVETDFGLVFAGVVRKERILDASECWRVVDWANRRKKCKPVIWNTWDRMPADSASLASLIMGRAIECCAPIIISDRSGIHELVELSNWNKIPARRTVTPEGEATVDIRYALGLRSAFTNVALSKVVKPVPRGLKQRALARYRSLG